MTDYLSTVQDLVDAGASATSNMKDYYELTTDVSKAAGKLTEAGDFAKTMGKLSAGLGMLGAGLGVASIVFDLFVDNPDPIDELSSQMEKFESNMIKQFDSLSNLVEKESAIGQIEDSVNFLIGVKDKISFYKEKLKSETTQEAATFLAKDLKSISELQIYNAINDIKQNIVGGSINTNILQAYYNSTKGETTILYSIGKNLFDLAGFALSASCLLMGLKSDNTESGEEYKGLKVADIETREEEYQRFILKPIYDAWKFWVNECIENYKYSTISWGTSTKYDTGGNLSVAMDNNGNVVDIHCGSPDGDNAHKHYYRVGKVNLKKNTITWGDYHQYDTGGNHSVAMDNNGNVVDIHSGSPNGDNATKHYYRIGKVDFNKKTISWGTSTKYDTGGNFSVAMDNNGNVVDIHRGSRNGSNANKHYYRVGKVNFRNKTITWGTSTKYDTGGNLSVAMDNNGNVVDIHSESIDWRDKVKHYYRVGKVDFNKKTITWGTSTKYDTGGNLSVAMNDNGNVVDIHSGSPAGDNAHRHYYLNGKVNFINKTISWEKSTKYDTGGDLSIATDDNGNVIDIHSGSFNGDNANKHYYRVGELVHEQ
jgi:hypothetical protein